VSCQKNIHVEEILPTCITIFTIITEKINFPWGQPSLRRILHKLDLDGESAIAREPL
jgi:hypothetical protein